MEVRDGTNTRSGALGTRRRSESAWPAGFITSASSRRWRSCCCATAAASPRWWSIDAADRERSPALLAETVVEVEGTVVAQRAGARWRRSWSTRRSTCWPSRRRRRRSSCAGRSSTRSSRRCSITPRCRCGTRRRALAQIAAASVSGFRAALDDARLHRDLHAQGRRLGHRERRQRVPDRLVRPTGLPRPEPAVLQADHGRRVRARLRGRAGVPRRAPRHRPPPGRVRVARRRDGVHRRPPRRDERCCATCSPAMVDAIADTASAALRAARPRAARGSRRDPRRPLRRRADT